MSSINKMVVMGRLGRDPEVRSFQNGNKVVNLRVATSQRWRDRETGDQQERTEWHSIAIYAEHPAKIAEQYLRKGDLVYLEGALETRKWQDQSGTDRYTTEVVLRPYSGMLLLMPNGGEDRGGGRGDGGSSRGSRSGGGESSGGGYGGGGYGGGRSDMDDEIPF